MIAKRSVEELKLRADIVSIIEKCGVEVKKQGASFVCLCPFHADKNPSMHINLAKGFYHCFSCSAGGDVFKFVQEYNHISFQEAVEFVASASNFALEYDNKKQSNEKPLKHILPLLNAFYKAQLARHKEALDYLYKRNLNDEDIRGFELGFAPSSASTLRLLQNENIDFKEALEVGALKISSKNTPLASFFERITFPIYDHKDLLIGFGARSLDANNPAKYINSNQNRLFDKSRVLYAYNIAKAHIAKSKEMIICEGYMDVIAFHKAGFKNAVAVLGVALTQHHLPLIKRLECKVILCFDNDSAGKNAALRSAHLLCTHKIDGKVVILKEGKDPAELVSNNQSKVLFEVLENALEMGEFFIRESISRMPLNTPLEKQFALESVQKFTFLLEDVVASSYTRLVAQLLGLNESLIHLTKSPHAQRQAQMLSRPKAPSVGVNLAEFEILKFLYENKAFVQDFKRLSEVEYFKHKDILEKVLLNFDENEPLIRQMLLFDKARPLASKDEFLSALLRLNLSFLNQHASTSLLLANKKQILDFLEKNKEKIKKSFQSEEAFWSFFEGVLFFVQHESNIKRLEIARKNFLKQNFTLEI